jgi:predicted unusual protein kinase regulating ubiquinone biosynthesis (AarF/ABC1/UbiB family)
VEGTRLTSRITRSTKIGRLAAGHAARGWAGRAADLARSEDAAQQARMRRSAESAERMVEALGTMKGAAMKVGQVLSFLDVGIVPPDQREAFQEKLAKLQSMAPSVRFKDMRKVIESELGPIKETFASFDEDPIASASIGQVYRASLDDGRAVAVKVQYPKARDAVTADMQNLGMLLKVLARIAPGVDTEEVAAELRERVMEELDYELEAANHRAIARAYREHPFIAVPGLVGELCGERVLVSEFVDGAPFSEARKADDQTRSRLGETLFRFYLGSSFHHRMLSGDPHPGNSIFLADGRVAFLDFGLFKRIGEDVHRAQVDLLRSAAEGNAEGLDTLFRSLDAIDGDVEAEKLLATYLEVIGWMVADEEIELEPDLSSRVILSMADLKGSEFGQVRLPAELAMTTRAAALTLGVLGQLRCRANWFSILSEWLYDDEPATELGRQEALWAEGRQTHVTR